MSPKGLIILGTSLFSVLIATLLLWVIVDRGSQIQTKEQEKNAIAERYGAKIAELQRNIDAMRENEMTKEDAKNFVTRNDIAELTKGLASKDSLRGYATSEEFLGVKRAMIACLQTLVPTRDPTASSAPPSKMRDQVAACKLLLR